MIHYVNGRIVFETKIGRYDSNLANHIVFDFFMRQRKHFRAQYDYGLNNTLYARIEGSYIDDTEIPPFVKVLNLPNRVIQYRLNDSSFERKMEIVSIKSGDHTGPSDIEAREVYNISIDLLKRIQINSPIDGRLELLFDDEKQLYLPADFRRLMTKKVA